MTRTMVYLNEEIHHRLKHLAVERHTSLTALIREAVSTQYREALVKLSHAKNKSRAVAVAIQAYVRRQRLQELLALRGQLTFDRTVLRLRHRER